MHTVSVTEVRTHYAALLQRMTKGETVIITRRGIPVAELRPIGGVSLAQRMVVIDALLDYGRSRTLGGPVKELIEEGRM
jgi:antitoxin (DNA-binding transcriptional repressor) of toxin-antitoxin stability system